MLFKNIFLVKKKRKTGNAEKFSANKEHLQLSGIDDDHSGFGLSGVSSGPLDLLDEVHAGGHLAEHHVTLIEPRAGDGGDEELWTEELGGRKRSGGNDKNEVE